jgi:hypothetical protein
MSVQTLVLMCGRHRSSALEARYFLQVGVFLVVPIAALAAHEAGRPCQLKSTSAQSPLLTRRHPALAPAADLRTRAEL